MALRCMSPRRNRITMVALEIVVSPQAAISTKLKRKIGYRDGIVDDDMAKNEGICTDRNTRINIPRDRCEQPFIGSQQHLDVSYPLLNPRNGGKWCAEAGWHVRGQMA